MYVGLDVKIVMITFPKLFLLPFDPPPLTIWAFRTQMVKRKNMSYIEKKHVLHLCPVIARWLECLTGDQKVVVSSPAWECERLNVN